MIITNKGSGLKSKSSGYVKVKNFLSRFKFKFIPIKYPTRTIVFACVLSIIIWTTFFTYIIYRNTSKPMVIELAEVIGIKATHKKKKSLESIKAVISAPINWVKARFLAPKVSQLHIDIKFDQFQKIQQIRDKAIAERQLTQGLNDYVPAKIRIGERTVKVKMRLKGDGIDHLRGDKWSFRIHTKGKGQLFGMRRFSIQSPATRNFESETLFFEALRREGLLAPRYFFSEVIINGKNIGLMAVEEHFSKELLESQGRREGVIMKFNEYLLHEELNGSNGLFPILANYKNVDIQAFRKKRISSSKTLSSQLELARGRMRSFQLGEVSASEIFDPETMGRFIALCDLWGAWHTIQWHNLRLYFNPITTKLEPIAYDATVKESRNHFPTGYPLASDILNDESILASYKRNIARIVEKTKNGRFLAWAKPFQEKQLKILHNNYPFYSGLNLDELANRMQQRGRQVENYGDRYEFILRAYAFENRGNLYLELENYLPETVMVSNITLVDNNGRHPVILKSSSINKYPFRVASTKSGSTPVSSIFEIGAVSKDTEYYLEISAHILGQDNSSRIIKSIPYHPVLKKLIIPEEPISKLLARFTFLEYDKKENVINIKPGKWNINSWITIPKETVLTVGGNTELSFAPSTGLISYGPVTMKGSRGLPIIFKGLGSLKEKQPWQGIVILNSEKPSRWSHVQINNTSGINKNGWALSGGVNFYESDIKMDHVNFIGNRSEDALNIVRSKFDLKSVTIKNTTSDGFDSDFSSGTIENSRFVNIGSQSGGDGIDVSGSKVTVTNSYFENISDKGISVGENSNLKATNIDIKNADIGIASKDGSLLAISDSKFSEIRKAGLMSYIKKPEYGSSEIMAKNITIESIGDKFISQNGSKITIDGVETSSVDLNVKNLYSPDVGQ